MPSAVALQAASEDGAVIGHLTHVEGTILRYGTDDDDWVQLVKDSPVGIEDLLFCEEGSKAEIIIPNSTWIRTGSITRLRIINLTDATTELEVESGLARFYNKSSVAVIKVATPFGSVLAPPLTAFDLYLQDDTVQVTALVGTVTFNYLRDNSNHEVKAGGASLLADYETVNAAPGATDEAWNAWNREMDEQWEDRLQDDGEEIDYLPDGIRHESYSLRENGIWETVYYEGRNCSLWRPLYVSSYWSPYTVGRWTVWYGDQCWIPYEPFGYVTHHYGNWIYIDGCSRWYWAPPDCHRRHNAHYFPGIPFAWYPGRVAWIHQGDYVGWIPLAPFEPYYCYRNWGSLSRVVAKDPRRHHRDLDIKACRYRNQAIIVKKSNLYRAGNYSNERINNRAAAFIEQFQREAGISSRVMHNVKNTKQRFAFDTRDAKKMQRSTAGIHAPRIKAVDHLLVKNRPATQNVTTLPGRNKTIQQPVKTLPVRTRKSPDIQIIKGTNASTFKPIQRYKPDITLRTERTKLSPPPVRKGQIGIPGGEPRQVLPPLKRQRPAIGPGVTFQKRELPRTLHMQRQESTTRLKADRPASYTNRGGISRPSLIPQSPGFGRR
jgi:hypothetical protein